MKCEWEGKKYTNAFDTCWKPKKWTTFSEVENQEKSTGKKWFKKKSFLEEDGSDNANVSLRAQSRFLVGSGRLRRPIKRKGQMEEEKTK